MNTNAWYMPHPMNLIGTCVPDNPSQMGEGRKDGDGTKDGEGTKEGERPEDVRVVIDYEEMINFFMLNPDHLRDELLPLFKQINDKLLRVGAEPRRCVCSILSWGFESESIRSLSSRDHKRVGD